MRAPCHCPMTRAVPQLKRKGIRASIFTGADCARTYSMGQLSGRSAMRAAAGPPDSGTGCWLYPRLGATGCTEGHANPVACMLSHDDRLQGEAPKGFNRARGLKLPKVRLSEQRHVLSMNVLFG